MLAQRGRVKEAKIAMDHYPPTSAVIVAGGRSTRLGQDKRRLRLWGEAGPTLLEHTIAVAAQLCSEVIVVLNDRESWPSLMATLVADAYPDAGPLGGIATGLQQATNDYALTLSADLPLLNPALLKAMLHRERTYDALIPRRSESGSGTVDATGPRNRRGLETLHAIYSRRCLPAIEARLAAGQRQIISFLDDVSVVEVSPQEWRSIDPHGHSFKNINTPEQLVEVQHLLS
ncbi:MAG: putative molybdenum cofactor guanylyltransferase [Herpetosiphonaceae bacterium]|nr:MAG: putative molybdenum cofactor guanylyltransferase [Herpetosiphonaceae bacterium]